MFKLTGRQNLDDCKWYGVEDDVKKDPEAVMKAMVVKMKRHDERQKTMPKYDKTHHGGYDY